MSACLDALDKKSRRVLPMDLGPPADPDAPMTPPRLEPIWLEPCPEDLYAKPATAEGLHPEGSSTPEDRYGRRESVALAFLAALQLLPAKQRAVLILRDVIGWQAAECGELLGLSVAAVNSALQRARETVAARCDEWRSGPPGPVDRATSALLARYVQAWEGADVSALVSLLHEDATLAMPPLPSWLRGPADIGASIQAMVLSPDAAGRFRLLPIEANGVPAFAAYERDPAGGERRAAAIHLLEIKGGRITALTAFLDASLFAAFGLPQTLAESSYPA